VTNACNLAMAAGGCSAPLVEDTCNLLAY